jgi:hypothetical protein
MVAEPKHCRFLARRSLWRHGNVARAPGIRSDLVVRVAAGSTEGRAEVPAESSNAVSMRRVGIAFSWADNNRWQDLVVTCPIAEGNLLKLS